MNKKKKYRFVIIFGDILAFLFGITAFILLNIGMLTNNAVAKITGIYFLIVTLILGIYIVIMGLKLVYDLWKYVPKNYMKTTSGKAIGYLFIPFFDFYWVFICLVGLASGYNRYIRDQNSYLPELSKGVCISISLLGVITLILGPIVGGIAFLFGGHVLLIVSMYLGIISLIINIPVLILVIVFIMRVTKILEEIRVI